MTTPGALPARPSLMDVPPVPPAEMTAEEQEQWTVAQIAAITLAAAAARQQVTDNVVIQLVPMLRLINPYSEAAIERFAKEAAALVRAGIDEVGRIAWMAVTTRLSVQGVRAPDPYTPPEDGRTTDLEVAYKRVAADYRRRVAAGAESIKGTIQQAEEERFQAIGGAVVAQGRTGQSNEQVQGTKRSPTSGGSSKPSEAAGSGGAGSTSGSGANRAGDGGSGSAPKRPATDRPVNTGTDDWSADDELDRAERAARDAEDDAADEAARLEAELRREAALSESERQKILEQVAQQEMEIRLERMVNDDMGMANRSAFRRALRNVKQVRRYRRVLHPELATSGQSCGLCIAASHRTYRKADLLPLHNLCHCEPVEIVGNRDVGGQINDEDLDILYGAAGDSTERTALSNTKWAVEDHGELGPRLVQKKKTGKNAGPSISFGSRESSTDRGGQS